MDDQNQVPNVEEAEEQPSHVEAVYPKAASNKTKPLAACLVIAVIVAIVGFVLFFVNSVPSGSAAKVNNEYITEQRVAEWIEQNRSAYGLSSDEDFASSLKSQSMTVVSYRQNAIDQLILEDLIAKRGEELGLSVSDEEIQAKLDQICQQSSNGDQDLWQQTLDSMGITEDQLKTRYEASIMQDKVVQADVPVEEATDDEVLSYMSNNLTGSTQKHVYRIVFKEDDSKTTNADLCYKKLKQLKKAGKFNTKAFEKLAREYSDEDGVEDSGGSLAWTGSGYVGDDVSEVVEDMKKGEFSAPTTIEADDNALEIIYVDDVYTFPDTISASSPDEVGVPDELMIAVRAAAGTAAWQSDCSSYLAKMLADAEITYYPVPKDASYNVDLS